MAIWLALLILTGVTAGIAFIDLGPFNTIVALVIASCKALLVVLFFMHVKYTSEQLVKVVVISAVFFFLLLLGLAWPTTPPGHCHWSALRTLRPCGQSS